MGIAYVCVEGWWCDKLGRRTHQSPKLAERMLLVTNSSEDRFRWWLGLRINGRIGLWNLRASRLVFGDVGLIGTLSCCCCCCCCGRGPDIEQGWATKKGGASLLLSGVCFVYTFLWRSIVTRLYSQLNGLTSVCFLLRHASLSLSLVVSFSHCDFCFS